MLYSASDPSFCSRAGEASKGGDLHRMVQGQKGDRGAQMNPRGARRARTHDRGRVGHGTAVEQEVVLGEPETIPAQLLGERDLLEYMLVIHVERRIPIRKVGRKQVHMETHWSFLRYRHCGTKSRSPGIQSERVIVPGPGRQRWVMEGFRFRRFGTAGLTSLVFFSKPINRRAQSGLHLGLVDRFWTILGGILAGLIVL